MEKGRNLVMCTKRTLCLWLALGLFLAGCGYNGISTTGASSTATGSAATPTGVVRLTPGGPGATSTATASPRGTAGQGVAVRASASLYRPGQTIVVTIFNHSAHPIFFANHQTNCTVVLLQVQTGSLWQPVALCKLMIVTRWLSLGAGNSLSVALKPGQAGWTAGTYRIAFRYASNAPAASGSVQDIFSSLFRVS